MAKYVFDKMNQEFRKATHTVEDVLLTIVKYFLVSVALAVIYYTVFALLISTDTERMLRRENRIYSEVMSEMKERESLVSDVITSLQIRDDEVYRNVFYTRAPSIDPAGTTGFLAMSDTISDRNIVMYTAHKSDALLDAAEKIEDTFRKITGIYTTAKDSLPPLSLPLKNVSYAQVGASLGDRMNPFYKVQTQHNGLDMIAPQGDPVYASADGVVSQVLRSHKGQGNVVEISHASGYVTRYCHLGDIEVSKGQVVKKGRKIGYIGISGNSFMPHLHYEVVRNGQYMDPVQHLFASVTPDIYVNMLYMSVNTGQSMD